MKKIPDFVDLDDVTMEIEVCGRKLSLFPQSLINDVRAAEEGSIVFVVSREKCGSVGGYKGFLYDGDGYYVYLNHKKSEKVFSGTKISANLIIGWCYLDD